jgi:aromatic-L-amino-acid decarboxylase
MDIEEFRKYGHELVDWVADFYGDVENLPVRSQVRPGDIAAKIPDAPPETGEPMERIIAEFKRDVLPGMTHWQHPSFFAYFPANSSPPSVLAEILTAGLGAQCMMWQTSPAATEMETKILDWLRQMTGLPPGFTGVIQDSASSATLCAILTAREKALAWHGNQNGLADHPPMTIYASNEVHSSLDKDAMISGLGRNALRKIAVDENYSMNPDALAAAIAEDRAAGRLPICVVATLGSTGIGAIDRLRPIGEICRSEGVYFHVDAAWAGSALVLPEWQWMIEGVEFADSFVFNPHKWMFTNFDCSAHFLRDPDDLVRTLSILPEYLKTREGSAVIDYRDWSVPLGRRFRALKLWFVIRSYGVAGLRERIGDHIAMAERAYSEVQALPDFDIMAPLRLALFNFRYHPVGIDDEAELERLNEELLQRLNDSGELYLTQNRVGGRFSLRFVVGQTNTREDHVAAAWAKITETARAIA